MYGKASHSPGLTSQRQQGATLIVVMIIMVLITLLGLTAMRMGVTSLAVSTNSQVGNLLFQSADAGLTNMVGQIAGAPATAMASGGLLNLAVKNLGTEYRYCLTPKGANRLTTPTSVCDVTLPANFMSARSAVAVQMSVQAKDTVIPDLGSDPNASAVTQGYTVKIYSTAVLPAFGSASTTTINGCLANVSDDSTNPAITTVTDCLTDAGAVFNTQVEERVLKSQFNF